MINAMVSIIIPVYNAEMYLKDTLKSIMNQTYKNLEIIIINDGSTDNSQNILEKFFEYLYDETFEDGATYFASQSQIPLTLFCSSFLMAKLKSVPEFTHNRLENLIITLTKVTRIFMLI